MRTQCLLVTSVVIVALVLVGDRAGVAQTQGFTTPWGDPDLQGLWSNQTPVPFERPPELAGKPVFTKEEAAEFERTHAKRLLESDDPVNRGAAEEFYSAWLDRNRVGPNRRTSLVIDPPDGRIPYTAEGRKRWLSTPDATEDAERAANRPEDRTLIERCIAAGGLFQPNPFYQNNHLIVQTPGYVAILTEAMHEHRIIPLDGRSHVGPNIRGWLGDSRGRLEGKTLVVETTNFNDQRRFHGATREMRVVERFTRQDADTISYRLTVTDSVAFTRPWTVENALWKLDARIYESGCHEGNYGLANILSGARADEKR